jgi:chaperonin GroES
MSKKVSKNNKTAVSKTLKIKPLGDRVLLQEIEEKERKTAGGIFLPEGVNSERDSKKGKVIAVGNGKLIDGKNIPPQVSVGDTVLYSWGDNVKLDGTDYTLVSFDNITAILE